jgi:SOS-response transcriptional repressor LexA
MTLHRDSRSPVERVYEFIVTYKRGHDGNSPTFREIMEGCAITSTSMVLYYLTGLEKRGLIRRPEPEIGNRNATKIEIVGGQWTKDGSHG